MFQAETVESDHSDENDRQWEDLNGHTNIVRSLWELREKTWFCSNTVFNSLFSTNSRISFLLLGAFADNSCDETDDRGDQALKPGNEKWRRY